MSLRKVSMLIAVALAGVLITASTTQAAFTLTFTQVGNDVDANGSGTLNLSALGDGDEQYVQYGGVDPNGELAIAGAYSPTAVGLFGIVSGPSSFGPGSYTLASSGTGVRVGIDGASLVVPWGYVSGGELSDTSVYSGTTISGLGFIPGDYVYTWGSGATADSFTIDIQSVPEPATLSLLAIGSVPLLARRRRKTE